jgi:hypothetical protein
LEGWNRGFLHSKNWITRYQYLTLCETFISYDSKITAFSLQATGCNRQLLTTQQASKIAKTYETKGGDYKNAPGSKNKAKKGPPEKKSAGESKSLSVANDATKDEPSSDEKKPSSKKDARLIRTK